MNDKRTNDKREFRREFLKRALVGSGAAIATIAGAGAAAAPEEKKKNVSTQPAPSQGYQETAHVREYYKTAQF